MRFKEFEANANVRRNKSKGIFIKEEPKKDNKKGVQVNEFEEDSDGDLGIGSNKNFQKTYKEKLGKCGQVDVKESPIVKDLNNQIKVKKELVKAKLMLEKFTTSRNKLDEILAIGMRDLGKGGLRYVDKRKVVIQNRTSFVKASSSSDSGECSNLMLIKNNKKNHLVGKVAFGDGKKGQILRKGTLNVLGMPRLKNM
ncbi:hypothetical protein Gohar_010146, partial [Gossypium harknessii]|nr:hypothetical protein [Gossypium harknessii]